MKHHHSADFDTDEKVIPLGAEIFVRLATVLGRFDKT